MGGERQRHDDRGTIGDEGGQAWGEGFHLPTKAFVENR